MGQHKCLFLRIPTHVFFSSHLFSAAAPKVPAQWRSAAGNAAPSRRSRPAGMRLAAGPSSQRASARGSHKAGSGPAALTWASPERRGKRSLRSHGNDSAPSLNPCMRVARRGGAREAHSPHARARAYGGRMRLPSPNARPPRRRRRRGGSGENG